MNNCTSYINCSAPLCPERGTGGIWYPDDEICRAWNKQDIWLRVQKKIQSKARNRNKYFTIEMLKRNPVVTAAIKGIDPDGMVPEDEQIRRWLQRRKTIKPWTDKQKKRAAGQMRQMHQKQKRGNIPITAAVS